MVLSNSRTRTESNEDVIENKHYPVFSQLYRLTWYSRYSKETRIPLEQPEETTPNEAPETSNQVYYF